MDTNGIFTFQVMHTKLAASRLKMCHLLIASFILALHLTSRFALASMNLPDGIENILGFVPTSSFQCERDGYFGDIDNDCRIFHLCQKQISSGGRVEWRHWTYACGNQTMFNQLTLTCAFVDEAIPCRHASQFQYLNEVIHKPREPFLTDADVTSGFSYYTNRVMSDGARARAFEDSRLMAQLGGQLDTPSSHSVGLSAVPETRQRLPLSSSTDFNRDAEDALEKSTNHLANDLSAAFQSEPSSELRSEFVIKHEQPIVQAQPQLAVTVRSVDQQQASQQVAVGRPQTEQQPARSDFNSFDFSFATNHQPGSAQPTARFFLNQADLVSTVATNLALGTELSQPASTASSLPLFASSESEQPKAHQSLAGSSLQTERQPATQVPTTTLANLAQPASTERQQVPTTTLASLQEAQGQPAQPSRVVRNQRLVSRQRQQQNQQQKQQTQRQRSDFIAHPHSAFQSTRIARQPESSAIVMRRQPARTQPAAQQSAQTTAAPQVAVGEPRLAQSSAFEAPNNFWRRSFDSHLMAPRFESLLTRRRV